MIPAEGPLGPARLDPDAAVYTLTHADGTMEELRQPYTRAAPHYRDGEPVWRWDGNAEAPTLTPSFHHRSRGVVVHLFLTRGAIRLCADSDAKVAS